MLEAFDSLVPRQVFELGLVLFLCFLLGLEREEHKARVAHYVFGGVRTFPLLGLVGYGLARVSRGDVTSLAVGFAGVAALMVVSYWHKVRADAGAGATTEVSGLLTYVLGALVQAQAYWLAVAIGVLGALLLELRDALARLTARLGDEDVLAVTKFLVLAIVILPVLPDRPLTRFEIDPFRAWLVVVAVSGLSYASYLLQRWLKERGGVVVTAILGGAYSSTATTVVLARRSRQGGAPRVWAGSILAASGMMYLRILVLVFLFDPPLAGLLVRPFLALAALAVGAGIALAFSRRGASADQAAAAPPKNPLELRPAFVFAALFVAVLVVTHLAVEYVGRGGLYGLAALFGLADVDPFVLGLSQAHAAAERAPTAAAAVAIAAAANNLAKGVYARLFGDRRTGNWALALLGGLAAAGLVPLLWP